jgi:hypothetical protein
MCDAKGDERKVMSAASNRLDAPEASVRDTYMLHNESAMLSARPLWGAISRTDKALQRYPFK